MGIDHDIMGWFFIKYSPHAFQAFRNSVHHSKFSTCSLSRHAFPHVQHTHKHKSQSSMMNIDPLTIRRGSLSFPTRRAVEQLSAEIACAVTTESDTATEKMVTSASAVMPMTQQTPLSSLEQKMEKSTRQYTANRMKSREIELSQ